MSKMKEMNKKQEEREIWREKKKTKELLAKLIALNFESLLYFLKYTERQMLFILAHTYTKYNSIGIQ